MTRSKHALLILILFMAAPLILSACQTGGGYSKNTSAWDYNNRRSNANAQSEPKPLADIYRENAQNAQARPPQIATNNNQQQLATAPQASLAAPIRIGLLLPLSGRHKALGESMLKAAQIALFDIGGETVELIPQDTGGTANGAKNAARSAINGGAQLMLGPLFADSVRAVKPITHNANINMIAFSTDWTLAGGNTFIMGFLPFDQVERLTRYVSAKNIGRVGVIAPESIYGNAVSGAYTSVAARYGVPTTARSSYSPATNNLSPILRQFTQYDQREAARAAGGAPAKPFEAVLMPVGGNEASAIASLLTHYDLPPRDVKRLGTGLMDDANLAKEPNLNGAWFAAPSPDLRRNYEQKFSATYGANPPRLSSLAYDATALASVLATRGVQQNGKPNFSRAAIANPNGFAGVDGIFRFRSDGTAERGLAILEFNRGQIKVIDPAPSTFEQTSY